MTHNRGFSPTAMSRDAFFRIRHLVKTFDDHKAVDDVSLDIAQGEVFALLGSSGSGKTTLLRMLAGFEVPTSGSIELEGVDLAGLPPYARPMNMMFQSYALFPHLSVADNIAFGLRRDGLAKDVIADRVAAMLKLVQLTAYAKRKPHQLSGGQQQRVALARSLAKQPRLLLLDEPLGALDKKLREETQVELSRIIHDIGVTCVMVTHDQEEAMTMASRMAVMSAGRFLQVGAPGEIYERPATRFVADFIGHVNLMEGRVTGREGNVLAIDCGDVTHRVESTAGAAAEFAPGRDVTVALRPEKMRIARAMPGTPADAPAGVNALRGTVQDIAYFGSYTVFRLVLGSGRVVKVTQSHADRHEAHLVAGDAAMVTWAPGAPVLLTA